MISAVLLSRLEGGKLSAYAGVDLSSLGRGEGGEIIRIENHLLDVHPGRDALVQSLLNHLLPLVEGAGQLVVTHLPDAVIVLPAEPGYGDSSQSHG